MKSFERTLKMIMSKYSKTFCNLVLFTYSIFSVINWSLIKDHLFPVPLTRGIYFSLFKLFTTCNQTVGSSKVDEASHSFLYAQQRAQGLAYA